MTLVIHIGQPKAASTSIQTGLWNQREALIEAGISYPVRVPKKMQHGPQVIDLFWSSLAANRARWPNMLKREQTFRLAGGWEMLCRDVAAAESAIVSAEALSDCGPELAARVVSELASVTENPTIMLCVRRPSAALGSSYAQVIQVQGSVEFEVWLRATLAGALGRTSGSRLPALNNSELRYAWSPVGELREVRVEGPNFEEEVLEVLGIADIVDRPFLPRANVSPSAARLVAWRRLQVGPPDPKALRDILRNGDPISQALPNGGGRFTIASDVAPLIDAAFSPEELSEEQRLDARRNLQERLLESRPLGSVGMDPDSFEAAVEVCLADMRSRLL